MSDEGDRERNGDDDGRSDFIVLEGGAAVLKTDDAHVFVAFINVRNEDARRMVIEPLELLQEKLPKLVTKEPGWSVTVNRINAEEPIHNPGPHHLLVNGLILSPEKQVHCTVHRSKKG